MSVAGNYLASFSVCQVSYVEVHFNMTASVFDISDTLTALWNGTVEGINITFSAIDELGRVSYAYSDGFIRRFEPGGVDTISAEYDLNALVGMDVASWGAADSFSMSRTGEQYAIAWMTQGIVYVDRAVLAA
jgi:hypothetical protein